MKRFVQTLVVYLAATVLWQSASTTAEQPPVPPVPQDPYQDPYNVRPLEQAKLDTLTADLVRANADLDKTVQTLIAMAKDETLSNQAQYKAIALLGKMPTKASLDFLIANISLSIPRSMIGNAESRFTDRACWIALSSSTAGWNTVQAIFDSLDARKSQRELGDLGILLKEKWPGLARAVVDHELKKLANVATAENERKKNLMAIRYYLPD